MQAHSRGRDVCRGARDGASGWPAWRSVVLALELMGAGTAVLGQGCSQAFLTNHAGTGALRVLISHRHSRRKFMRSNQGLLGHPYCYVCLNCHLLEARCMTDPSLPYEESGL